MSALDCPTVRDAAPEFALGVLDAELRSDVVQHLDGCAPCRIHVGELAEIGDAFLLLAPEAEPPPGFERRTLDAMVRPQRNRRWRTVKLVAAVAAAAAIFSIVTVRVIDQTRSTPEAVSTPTRTTAEMVGNGGEHVGNVDMIGTRNAAVLSVSVDYRLPDGAYTVAIEPTNGGARQNLGTMQVSGGTGTWSDTVALPPVDSTLLLLDGTGKARCRAALPVV